MPADGLKPNPAQAMLWGFGRSLAKEMAHLQPTLVDMDGHTTPEQLAAFLASGDAEPQSALRGATRFVAQLRPAKVEAEPDTIRPDAIYLITGGLGALGLEFTQWLVDQGARSVVLTGHGAPKDDVLEKLKAWNEAGADVGVIRGDASVVEDVARILAEIDAKRPPLAGVIHAAGVLDDGIVQRMTPERVQNVLRPKVRGSWNLHRATLDRKLDFFVMCASVAGLQGSPGQTNYAAANAGLDALCDLRRAEGVPATSIAWGPWGEVGMAASLGQDHHDRLAMAGLKEITPKKALRAMGQTLAGPNVAIVHLLEQPRAAGGAAAVAGGAAADVVQVSTELGPLHELVMDLPREQWFEALRGSVVEGLKAAFPEKTFETDKPLWDQGMDSMMVLEVRNSIVKNGVTLPMNRMIGGPPIDDIARMLEDALAADPRLSKTAPTLPGGVILPSEGKHVAPDEELQPLSPMQTHALAALGGALAAGGIVFVIMQFLV